MTLHSILLMVLIAVFVVDVVLHERSERRHRAELLEYAKAKRTAGLTVQVSCDATQFHEQIATVMDAAERASATMARLNSLHVFNGVTTMLKLTEVSFGVLAHDRITGSKGTVTGKIERQSGSHSVCLEGLDSTGRAFTDWIDIDRLELDADA